MNGLSSRSPDLAALIGPVHLGEAFVLAVGDDPLRLAYSTAMERDEAAAVGLDLLTPDDLGIGPRGGSSGDSHLGALWLRALEASGLTAGRVGVAGSGRAGELVGAAARLSGAGWQVVAADDLLRRLRKRKTRWEVDEIRRSAEGVCAAFHAVAAVLADVRIEGRELRSDGRPLTAGDLRRAIDAQLGSRGLAQPEGNIVSLGAEAGVPHTQGDSGRSLAPSEAIVVDLYPKDHLFADCTRTFCVGTAPEGLARAHRLVERALIEAVGAARPGVLARDLQANTCELFELEGMATPRTSPGGTRGYVHGLGHGVGFELHELPGFRSESEAEGLLAANDVITLEPGLYDPEEAGYGVRLEDLLLVTEDGTDCLTPLPYDLDPRAW